MATYHLTVRNDSAEAWTMYLFRRPSSLTPAEVGLRSLAWLSRDTAAQSSVTFHWDPRPDFVWARVTPHTPGAVFETAQTFPADPDTHHPATATTPGNQVNLTYHPHGDYFEFAGDPGVGVGDPGTLHVACDTTVPTNTAAVGVGMSGFAAFAVPAEPAVTTHFTFSPTVYLAAGVAIRQGKILDEQAAQAVALNFEGLTSLTATFRADHTWTVAPSR